MTERIERILNFLERCPKYTDFAGLLYDFEALVESLGITHFILFEIPWSGPLGNEFIVATNWSKEWRERYLARSYFSVDPVVRAAMACAAPFSWSEAFDRFGTCPGGREIIEDAARFGLVDGVGFPLLSTGSRRAAASLASDKPLDMEVVTAAVLQGILPVVFQHLRALNGVSSSPNPRLSKREKQVLAWLAAGKSAWEVAQILTISEPTVRFHVQAIKKKFKTSTLAHSVAAAIHAHQL